MTVTGLAAYTVDYTYDLNNRLLTEVHSAGSETETLTYTYDAAGNQLTKTSANAEAATESRSYNAAGQLSSVEVGLDTTEYTYSLFHISVILT